MEKSANTIGSRKFQRLTLGQKHKVLAGLAREALAQITGAESAESSSAQLESFFVRYHQLLSWSTVDHYLPPRRLGPQRLLEECAHFHLRLAGNQRLDPCSVPAMPPWRPTVPGLVVADHVRTPYNLGSLLRLVDNFGLEGLVHCGPAVALDHPQLVKAARGCQQWIPFQQIDDLPAWLDQQDRELIALENTATACELASWKAERPFLVLLGNEQHGLDETLLEKCHRQLAIPLYGWKASMNVRHAFAVFAYHVRISLRGTEP
jgi:tRNA(Leu) C34 or U34 (ribose-2'-O)-methylase TrmL